MPLLLIICKKDIKIHPCLILNVTEFDLSAKKIYIMREKCFYHLLLKMGNVWSVINEICKPNQVTLGVVEHFFPALDFNNNIEPDAEEAEQFFEVIEINDFEQRREG